MVEGDVVVPSVRWSDFSNFCPRSVGSMVRHGCHRLEPIQPPSPSRMATPIAFQFNAGAFCEPKACTISTATLLARMKVDLSARGVIAQPGGATLMRVFT